MNRVWLKWITEYGIIVTHFENASIISFIYNMLSVLIIFNFIEQREYSHHLHSFNIIGELHAKLFMSTKYRYSI